MWLSARSRWEVECLTPKMGGAVCRAGDSALRKMKLVDNTPHSNREVGGTTFMQKRRRSGRVFPKALLTTVIALLLATSAAFASATWSNISGPTWNGAAWVLTGTVTLRSPHHYACMHVTVPDGPNAGTFSIRCPAGGTSGSHPFSCTVLQSQVAGATGLIPWYLFADSNSTCGRGNITLGNPGVNGSIDPSDPTVVSLAGRPVASGSGRPQVPLFLASAALLSGISIVFVRRRSTST